MVSFRMETEIYGFYSLMRDTRIYIWLRASSILECSRSFLSVGAWNAWKIWLRFNDAQEFIKVIYGQLVTSVGVVKILINIC